MKNIATKLLQITKEIGHIKKSGYNSHQKYQYATEKDILEEVKTACLSAGVAHFCSVIEQKVELHDLKGKPNFLATVVMEHTFVDIESGENISVKSVGTGIDNQDKAIYKAMTGANKYVLSKTFMIASDDDPENDGVTAQNNKNSSGGGLGSKKPAPANTEAKPAPVKPSGSFGGTKPANSAPAPKSGGFGTSSSPAPSKLNSNPTNNVQSATFGANTAPTIAAVPEEEETEVF